MPREELERSESVGDLDRNKDVNGGSDLLHERLERSESFMRTTGDGDPSDERQIMNPSTQRMSPGDLGKGQGSAQRISRLDRAGLDPEQSPYESEHLGRFRLPGR